MKSLKGYVSTIALISFLFLPMLATAETTVDVRGEYIKASCDCTCKDKTIKSEIVYKQGSMPADGLAKFFGKILTYSGILTPFGLAETQLVYYYEIAYAKIKCGEQCAKSCGGYTSCDKDCTKCCAEYVSEEYKYDGKKTDLTFDTGLLTIEPEDDYIQTAEKSCVSACAYKSNIRSINEIVLYVVGVLGAIMLAVNGIRFMGSENPDQRAEARRGIAYTILAIIIIMLASTLVGILMETAMTPAA